MQVSHFSETSVLTSDLVKSIKERLSESIALRGEAYLVVSGGTTPIELFKSLSRESLPWEKVWITLADERCVASTHKDSNERLVRAYLLQNEAHNARFISLYDGFSEVASFLPALEARFSKMPLFDVVILGMGEDGHTASLFPYCEALETEALKAVFSVQPLSAPHQRITLSIERLLASRFIVVHILGEKKKAVLSNALAQSDPKAMPISAFLNHETANVHLMYAP